MNEAWTAFLYGSVARGDEVPGVSDLDVLLVSDSEVGDHLPQIMKLTARLPQAQHLSVAHYSWEEVSGMARYGSLFLWHVKTEGRALIQTIGTERFINTLSLLPEYQGASRDLNGFAISLRDVSDSLKDGGDVAFELGVIATVIRHASILACAQLNNPTYDRRSSVFTSFEALGLREFAHEAVDIYQFRLSAARGLRPQISPSINLANKWLSIASTLVQRMERLDACR